MHANKPSAAFSRNQTSSNKVLNHEAHKGHEVGKEPAIFVALVPFVVPLKTPDPKNSSHPAKILMVSNANGRGELSSLDSYSRASAFICGYFSPGNAQLSGEILVILSLSH
jgi:hypothetical protein